MTGPSGAPHDWEIPEDSSLKIVVAWHEMKDDNTVQTQIWTRGGMSGQEFISLLRRTADAWERDDMTRTDAKDDDS